LFFFFLMLIITTMRGIDLHPMNYFPRCAFFSFHLLLAYLIDHVSIHASFLPFSSSFPLLPQLAVNTPPQFNVLVSAADLRR